MEDDILYVVAIAYMVKERRYDEKKSVIGKTIYLVQIVFLI